MTRSLAAATLAGLAVGCSALPANRSTHEIVFSPCEELFVAPIEGDTDSARASLREGVALWRALELPTVSATPSAEAALIPVRFRDAPALFHGIYEPGSGEIVINTKLEGSEAAITLAHELGHALGLPHVATSERDSVMNPGNTWLGPTLEDRAQLHERWPECL